MRDAERPARSAEKEASPLAASPGTDPARNRTTRSERAAPRTKFRSLVLDVDSTLCGIEGVDWLAALRGADIAQRSAELTERAMAGEFPIEQVYGERLALIRPTRDEVNALAGEYRRALAPGARDAIAAMRAAGIRLILVSGGFAPAILPLARELGFRDADVFAVQLLWNAEGEYVDYDRAAPTARQRGKLETVAALDLPRPVLAVGDGATDLEMRPAVDTFAAFTGFVRRAGVVASADCELASFDALRGFVLR